MGIRIDLTKSEHVVRHRDEKGTPSSQVTHPLDSVTEHSQLKCQYQRQAVDLKGGDTKGRQAASSQFWVLSVSYMSLWGRD